MTPTLDELLDCAHVVTLRLAAPFRGIVVREALLLQGSVGWSEFSPFDDYSDTESASWLRAAIEFGWSRDHDPAGDQAQRIRVNATVPAVSPERVGDILSRFRGCRTVKIKVGGPSTTLADDVARVREVRRRMGPEGRVRVDANGAWNVDEAEHALHALAEFDLEYVEQPCASIAELIDLRNRTQYMGIPIAADESVRRESDPLEVARAGAADILVIKAQPLGGISRALQLVREAQLPAVVSSALETSVGIAMGAHLAARLPDSEFDCGLGTAALLLDDVTDSPLVPDEGYIDVVRPQVNPDLLARHGASTERTAWWLERLRRVYALL
ncbi:MAG: O-succinylbenzoate synthase [Microbacteriaceae bacterium]|nr:O-succinylbenzoate synthase [Microbacteriaceae bacterium]